MFLQKTSLLRIFECLCLPCTICQRIDDWCFPVVPPTKEEEAETLKRIQEHFHRKIKAALTTSHKVEAITSHKVEAITSHKVEAITSHKAIEMDFQIGYQSDKEVSEIILL